MKKETIEDVDLELPKAKLPRVEKEYFNLSDVAKCISTKGGLVDTGNTQELIPYKNAVITVDLQTDEDVTLSNKNITLYDLSVMDAVYTLLKSGRESFTPEMVCRVMSGNLNWTGC